MDLNKTYYISLEQYGKVIVEGIALPPIKKDPEFAEKYGTPEIGCCARTVYDKVAQAPRLEIIKRCASEKDVIYG